MAYTILSFSEEYLLISRGGVERQHSRYNLALFPRKRIDPSVSLPTL